MDDLKDCPDCGALNSPSKESCDECGASIAPAPTGGSNVKRAREAARARRSTTFSPIKRAKKALDGVRGLAWFYAGVLALNSLGSILGEGGVGGLDGLDYGWLGLTVLAFLAAAFLFRAPLVCATLIAILHSALTGALWLQWGQSLGSVVLALVAILLWLAVGRIRSALAVLEEEGGSTADLRGVNAKIDGAGMAKATFILGGSVMALIGGLIGYAVLTAAPKEVPMEHDLERWVMAFESGDFDTARAMCTDDYRERWPKVEAILDREGWLDDGVSLFSPKVTSRRPRQRAISFELPRGVMKTVWKQDRKRWWVDKIVMSRVRKRK